jgi:hypothetical protein
MGKQQPCRMLHENVLAVHRVDRAGSLTLHTRGRSVRTTGWRRQFHRQTKIALSLPMLLWRTLQELVAEPSEQFSWRRDLPLTHGVKMYQLVFAVAGHVVG